MTSTEKRELATSTIGAVSRLFHRANDSLRRSRKSAVFTLKRHIWLQFTSRISFRAFPLPPPSKALCNFTENGRFRRFRKKSPSRHKRREIDVSRRFEHIVFFPQKPVYPASHRILHPTLFQAFTKNPDAPSTVVFQGLSSRSPRLVGV